MATRAQYDWLKSCCEVRECSYGYGTNGRRCIYGMGGHLGVGWDHSLTQSIYQSFAQLVAAVVTHAISELQLCRNTRFFSTRTKISKPFKTILNRFFKFCAWILCLRLNVRAVMFALRRGVIWAVETLTALKCQDPGVCATSPWDIRVLAFSDRHYVLPCNHLTIILTATYVDVGVPGFRR